MSDYPISYLVECSWHCRCLKCSLLILLKFLGSFSVLELCSILSVGSCFQYWTNKTVEAKKDEGSFFAFFAKME